MEEANKNRYIKYRKQTDICFENIYPGLPNNVLCAKEKSAKNNYKTFIEYIKYALEAAKEKESASVGYELINKDTEYKLSKLICIKVTSKICDGKVLKYDENTFNVLTNLLGRQLFDIEVESIQINNQNVNFIKTKEGYVVEGDETSIVKINNDENIDFINERYYPSSIIYNDKEYINQESRVNIEEYDDENNYCFDSRYPDIKLKLNHETNAKSKDEIIFQLIDSGSNAKSDLDLFYTESAKEVYVGDEKFKNNGKIRFKKKELGRIHVLFDNHKYKPPKKGILHLVADTNQLKRQLTAINCLINRPSIYHAPLLKLADTRDGKLQNFDLPTRDNNQYLIFDKTNIRPGTSQQRDFVKKALATPDFMILQGPPGSGKTTAILELIYQLAKQNKKVLLCASTHVAVDNVLEKILMSKDSSKLLDVINPVRIGDSSNVSSECVKDYIYENLATKIPTEFLDIANKSFNLVCGTIIGVLNFPPIKKLLEDNQNSIIEPIFDYLIIDEASKTTFSEFLVPAILCKKWIIVGDVKQLAPYIDEEELTPNLIHCESLKDIETREAIDILRKADDSNDIKDLINGAFILKAGSIKYINSHLNENNSSRFIAASNGDYSKILTISKDDLEGNSPKCVCLSSSDNVILIEEGLEDLATPLLNNDRKLFDKNKTIEQLPSITSINSLIYKNKANNRFDFKDYRKKYNYYTDKIEDQIIWRLIRLYELGEEQKSYQGYKKFIDKVRNVFNPKERDNFDATINTLRNIAIPSIITMLQEGIDHNSSKPTTLTKGFSPEEKESRFVRLEYQHRMHPDISKFSRENIYQGVALKDSYCWQSHLNYPGTNSRAEIRNVHYQNLTTESKNPAEVDAIMKELDKFIKYLEVNDQKRDSKVEIAILAFYNAQVMELRKELRKYFKQDSNFYNFSNNLVHVSLNTVDKFQGQEADVVYLSMTRNDKTGFLDSVSRLNVAITRAKEQLIVFGDREFFTGENNKNAQLLKILFQ